MKKKKYLVNTTMNFSIAADEFYCVAGNEIELPDHELIDSLVIQKHIELVEKTKSEKK